jgi:hypothetical protein
MTSRIPVIALFVSLAGASSAQAQSFQADVHFSSAQWSEFDGSDNGIGGRFTFMPSSMIGLDADLTWYPSDFPPDQVAFSGSRIEGLFGATIGPRINRVRPFAKVAAGFLKLAEPPLGIVCPAIFPPPLPCLMAGGPTLPAYEIGGGIEVSATPRTFFRGDIGDRILKYPGPTFRNGLRDRVEDGFFGHAIRFTIGGGLRF